jgi:lipopolysaccharide/colanic/teichoic acid biosynthesis glycosyltransferase
MLADGTEFNMSVVSNTMPEQGHFRGNMLDSACNPERLLPIGSWYMPVKAASEFVLALLLLAASAPLLLLALLLVKLTSRGPMVYAQTRVGRGGRPFTIYKVRTMTHECENLTGACWSKPGDSRITGVGRWLRRTHLDELPQLWNVLKGDMSLVGPRPERPEFVPSLAQAIPFYAGRLQVRPGVTGLAQVQLPPDTDLASVRLKLAYDLHYVRHTGPWLDVRIHLATLLHMVGVPFAIIRGLLWFPRRRTIEQGYLQLAGPCLADTPVGHGHTTKPGSHPHLEIEKIA